MGIFAHWRGVSFSLLTVCATLLCVDVFGIFGGGHENESRYAHVDQRAAQAWNTLDDHGKNFLEREYDTAVKEIGTRIEYENVLFSLKFTLIGATLFLLFQKAGPRPAWLERTTIAALVAWAAVTVAALTDFRSMTNQHFLMLLGAWIRRYEELRLGTPAINLAWESFLADELLARKFYPALRVSSQILTALLFSVTAAIFVLQPYTRDRRAVLVSRVGALVSIAFMTAASVSLRRNSLAPCMHVTLGIVAAILALLLLRANLEEVQ